MLANYIELKSYALLGIFFSSKIEKIDEFLASIINLVPYEILEALNSGNY